MELFQIETDITSYVISGKTLKYVCRTCLQNENNMLSIFTRKEEFDKTHAEILMAFTPVNIIENDGHSSYICSSCIDFIISVYTYQQQCIQVDAILRFASVNTSHDDDETIDSKKSITRDEYLSSPTNEFEDSKIEIKDELVENIVETRVEEDIFICEICGDELPDIRCLNVHKRIHSGENNYECIDCGNYSCECSVSKYEDDVPTEIVRLNHSFNFECQICKQTFYRKNALVAHKVTVHNEHPCMRCKKTFKLKERLKLHQIKWHPKPFKCDTCARLFSTRSGLNQHLVTHSNGTHGCECGKMFKRYSSLLLHKQSVHGAIRPFQCNICGKTFSQNIVLKNHMLTHNGGKPYKCNYCEKTFRQKPHVQSHELIHTGGKPYHCLICPKQFRHQNTLIHHTRIHTGENPFHCPICDRGFYHSTNMKKHLISHNKALR